MKKSIAILLLTALSVSAFAVVLPQQEKPKKKQDTTKRNPLKSKWPKHKKDSKDTTWRDTMKRKPIDTNRNN